MLKEKISSSLSLAGRRVVYKTLSLHTCHVTARSATVVLFVVTSIQRVLHLHITMKRGGKRRGGREGQGEGEGEGERERGGGGAGGEGREDIFMACYYFNKKSGLTVCNYY